METLCVPKAREQLHVCRGFKPTAWDKELTFVWQFDSNVELKDGKRIHGLPSDSDCSLFVFWLSTFGFSILSKSHL